jgi:hypothetical protein
LSVDVEDSVAVDINPEHVPNSPQRRCVPSYVFISANGGLQAQIICHDRQVYAKARCVPLATAMLMTQKMAQNDSRRDCPVRYDCILHSYRKLAAITIPRFTWLWHPCRTDDLFVATMTAVSGVISFGACCMHDPFISSQDWGLGTRSTSSKDSTVYD